jgi:methionyl-tRNA formyltransferase
MPLRVVFMGTPEFAAATLRAVADAGHAIVAVYTQPPRPAGRRGLELTKSPVHHLAEELGVEVRTPVSLKGEAEQAAFRDLDTDVAVVVAYGLLLPKPILDGTRLGCYNGHASLLPRWRGAAPIQRAIEAGDEETGVSIMRPIAELDAGPVCLQRSERIRPDDDYGSLAPRLAALSGSMLAVAGGNLRVRRASHTDELRPNLGNFVAFRSTPLWSVAEELELHFGVRVDIRDPDVGGRTVTAAFQDDAFSEVVSDICRITASVCTITDSLAVIAGR